MELRHCMGLVQASHQELLGPGPRSGDQADSRGGHAQGHRERPPGLVVRPPVDGRGGDPDHDVLAGDLEGRTRPRADPNLDERAAGCLPNRLHVPPRSPRPDRRNPVWYRAVIPEATMSRQWRRRERVPGQPGRSEPGTVRARRSDPANILPEPPPEPGPTPGPQ